MKPFILYLCLTLSCSTFSDTRIWTFKNGRSLEAEFVSLVDGRVSLENLKGKIKKVPEGQFVDEDIQYIELQMPPKLDLSFSKSSKMRVFPDTNSNEIPRSQYYDFKALIKQLSTRPYTHELTAELFIVAEEKAGGKYILVDYQKKKFRLEKGSKSVVAITSRTVEIMEYVMNGQLRGESYTGYLIIITDSRGEIIAYKTRKEEWFNNVENLRKLPIGKIFDEEGNRDWPTRPKRFY